MHSFELSLNYVGNDRTCDDGWLTMLLVNAPLVVLAGSFPKVHQTFVFVYQLRSLTLWVQLGGALTLLPQSHHGGHLGSKAGAPLLVVVLVIIPAQRAHVSSHTGALGDVGARSGRRSPVFHFRCKLTVSHVRSKRYRKRKGEEDRDRKREEGTGFSYRSCFRRRVKGEGQTHGYNIHKTGHLLRSISMTCIYGERQG